MDRDSELELVDRLRRGDAAAFDAVYAAFSGRLFNFLVRLSRRREVAEDLAEETWLRLVAHAGRLRPDTRLASWLFAVARNLYVSYRRSRFLEASHTDSLIGLWPFPPPSASPLDDAAAGELVRRLDAAIAALPLRYREAVLLVGLEGMQPAEAAAVCGITAEAMRQRLSRARAMLAGELAKTEPLPFARWREVTT